MIKASPHPIQPTIMLIGSSKVYCCLVSSFGLLVSFQLVIGILQHFSIVLVSYKISFSLVLVSYKSLGLVLVLVSYKTMVAILGQSTYTIIVGNVIFCFHGMNAAC